MAQKQIPNDLLDKIKKNFSMASDAWDKQFKLSAADFKFCSPDAQWDDAVKQSRAGRPTYASDRINSQVKQLVNAQRENRPAVQVHPTGDVTHEDLAEVFQGLIRHIEYDSDADLSYDQAFEDAVRGGFGCFRVLTAYEEGSFDQVIKIDSIINPFSVLLDPGFQKLDGSDIRWCFITDSYTEEEFKVAFPSSDLANSSTSMWLGNAQRLPKWFQGKTAIVAEYFEKSEKTKTIVKLADGRVLDKKLLSDEEKPFIVLERQTQEPTIRWYKVCGTEILEEQEWPGTRIPVIPVFGDVLLVDGERVWSGLVRKVKEEQQMLNVAKTTAIELIAQAPKTPWVGPVGFVGNRKADWQDVNLRNLAYLEYEIIDDMDNPLPPPTRNVQEPPVQGILEIINSLEMDIKATNNMFDPSMGQKVNNQSGKAVLALQNQGSITNYHFSDNLSRAIRLLGRILLDLIPKIYNEKRVIRIVDITDEHKLVTLNGEGVQGETGCMTKKGVTEVFDMSSGKFDVTVSSGPSYQTKRQENLNVLFDLAGKDPQLMAVAGDIIVSQLDSPIAIQLTDRLKRALPPGLLEAEDEELPPEVVARFKNDQDMIKQLTDALQKETELANRLKSGEDTKLEIAKIQQQTELMKAQAQGQHETNVLAFKEEVAGMRQEGQTRHEILSSLHQHILAKDEHLQKAELQIAAEDRKAELAHQTALETAHIKVQGDHEGKVIDGVIKAAIPTPPAPKASLKGKAPK